MRKTKRSGGFLICLLLNACLNIEGIVPAVILYILYVWMKISLWWSLLALAVWLMLIILDMLIIRWAARCGDTPDPPKENRNPYSAGGDIFRKR